MPNKLPGETKDHFIQRCMHHIMNNGEAQSQEQGIAICISKWESFDDLDVKELTIDLAKGIDKISLVENPAVEVDFMYFNKQEKIQMANVNKEQQIITGPAMIPDKLIYRRNENTGKEFYVYFTKETVKQTAELYLKQHKQEKTSLDHADGMNSIQGVYLFESWIVEDPNNDKSKALGFDVPQGTWMVSMKVDNKDVWNEMIKQHEINGFSIEGDFISNFSGIERKIEDCEKVKLLMDVINNNIDLSYFNFANDPKEVYKMWVLGADEDHCPSCVSLNGFVMTEDEWNGLGPAYTSNGRYSTFCEDNCKCKLVTTTADKYNPVSAERVIQQLNAIRNGTKGQKFPELAFAKIVNDVRDLEKIELIMKIIEKK